MDNKYFTPDIEDIRVGYELESHNWSMDEMGIPELNYDRWEKWVLNKADVKHFMKYGIRGSIRVPYLTKEQIEAEGWKLDFSRHITPGIGYCKDNAELNYYHGYVTSKNKHVRTTTILIRIDGRDRYLGDCKSINEFRYINKLLGITSDTSNPLRSGQNLNTNGI